MTRALRHQPIHHLLLVKSNHHYLDHPSTTASHTLASIAGQIISTICRCGSVIPSYCAMYAGYSLCSAKKSDQLPQPWALARLRLESLYNMSNASVLNMSIAYVCCSSLHLKMYRALIVILWVIAFVVHNRVLKYLAEVLAVPWKAYESWLRVYYCHHFID